MHHPDCTKQRNRLTQAEVHQTAHHAFVPPNNSTKQCHPPGFAQHSKIGHRGEQTPAPLNRLTTQGWGVWFVLNIPVPQNTFVV